MSLSVEKVRLSDIKKTNTELRLHSPAQRKKARRLFERQGIVAPIILDERFNIIDGRLRFECPSSYKMGHQIGCLTSAPLGQI